MIWKKFSFNIKLPIWCFALSVLIHLLAIFALRMFGTYQFGAPVGQPSISVSLSELANPPAAAVAPAAKAVDPIAKVPAASEDPLPQVQKKQKPEEPAPAPKPAEAPIAAKQEGQEQPRVRGRNRKDRTSGPPAEEVPAASSAMPRTPTAEERLAAQMDSGDFLGTRYEKLTYLISMLGIPVGNAELEARNENGEIAIALRIVSNAAISNVFPVNNVIETRHIGGRFIMASIKQQEGSFRSDEMFTINRLRKIVSWNDNVTGRLLKVPVPANDVLDTLSGIYYLRNRQLEVGKTETLHIFDSETYADVPVEVLQREEIRLPNLKKIGTIIVRPMQKTAGIFRRTGDLLIWLTDDENKVPVKIVTSIPLGTVTAELISAEAKPHGEAANTAPAPAQQPGSTMTPAGNRK